MGLTGHACHSGSLNNCANFKEIVTNRPLQKWHCAIQGPDYSLNRPVNCLQLLHILPWDYSLPGRLVHRSGLSVCQPKQLCPFRGKSSNIVNLQTRSLKMDTNPIEWVLFGNRMTSPFKKKSPPQKNRPASRRETQPRLQKGTFSSKTGKLNNPC